MQEASAAIASPARFFIARPATSLVQIAPAALAGVVVGELAGEEQSLPLASTQNGNVFRDRLSATIAWYLPAFALTGDNDAAFAFKAVQTFVASDGSPFDTLALSVGVAKQMPPDAVAFAQQNPTLELREIPLDGLAATLTTTSNDPQTGAAQSSSCPGTLCVCPDGSLSLAFGPLLGTAVIVAYENLQTGGASIALTASYRVWRQQLPRWLPRRPTLPFAVDAGDSAASELVRPRMMMHPILAAAVDDVGGEPTISRYAVNVALANAYASVAYATRYTLTSGSITQVIASVADLKNFNTRQSQFREFTALGDVAAKYPSFCALYIGALSRTVVALPTRYGIVRGSNGTAAVCRALLDTSPAGGGNCTFEFSFLLGPVISPIDLIGLSNDIAASTAAHDCTLSLPLQFSGVGTLATPFASSATFASGAVPGTFTLVVSISDAGASTSAVANANLFIKALTTQVEPFLAGQTAITLDDSYEHPVVAGIVVNFSQTSGTDDVGVTIAPDGSSVVLANCSPLDLSISRYALAGSGAITVQPLQQELAAKQSASIPTNGASGPLTVLVERTLALESPFTKAATARYLAFDVVDVADVAYQLGVVASGVSFSTRGIAKIDIAIVVTTLPELTVPGFSLTDLDRSGNQQITIPVMSAISTLPATLAFTVTPASGTPATFTLTNDFIDQPVFILDDAQIPGFPAASS